MMVWLFTIVVVVGLAVSREKKRHQQQVQPQSEGTNNIVRNKNFLTTKKVVMFAVLLMLGPVLSAIAPHLGNKDELKIVAYLLLHLVHPFITLIIIPVNILVSKPDFKKFACGGLASG